MNQKRKIILLSILIAGAVFLLIFFMPTRVKESSQNRDNNAAAETASDNHNPGSTAFPDSDKSQTKPVQNEENPGSLNQGWAQ